MSKTTDKTTAQQKSQASRRNLIVFLVVFALVGGLVVWRSKAAPVSQPASTTSSSSTNASVSAKNDLTPLMEFSSPKAGQTVNGSIVNLEIKITNGSNVQSVQYKVDGSSLGDQDTSPPFSAVWNTTSYTNGTHLISATAINSAGDSNTLTIPVTVKN